MLRGDSYDAADPALLAERLEARVHCERLNGLSFADNEQRHAILRELLGSLGDRAEVPGRAEQVQRGGRGEGESRHPPACQSHPSGPGLRRVRRG